MWRKVLSVSVEQGTAGSIKKFDHVEVLWEDAPYLDCPLIQAGCVQIRDTPGKRTWIPMGRVIAIVEEGIA